MNSLFRVSTDSGDVLWIAATGMVQALEKLGDKAYPTEVEYMGELIE